MFVPGNRRKAVEKMENNDLLTNCFECMHFSATPPIETGIPLVRWRFMWCDFFSVQFYGYAEFHFVFCPEFKMRVK